MGTLTREHRWMLPAELTVRRAAERPPRRSTRDWLVDTLCFLLGLGFALFVTADLLSANPSDLGWPSTPTWLAWADLVVGVLAAFALWWRRRWPVGITMIMLLLGLFSVASAVTLLIMLFTVAVHRRPAVVVLVGVLSFVVGVVFVLLRPEPGIPFWQAVGWNVAFILVVQLWGMVHRVRRQLVVSLRDRAERAESEQQLRVVQARTLERTRIAREMHDVLAHRISLLSLHAGALEIRPDAAPAEVAQAAGIIRASAHQALQDLRQVIGVLRAASDETAPERPQPTLADLVALVDESRAAGVRVRLTSRIDEPSAVPEATGRSAYRIVQEGLTNARKHAPGTTVDVTVDGSAAAGLTIEVSNPLPLSGTPVAAIPGTGTGLVGLTERASLAGGRLSHGRTADGTFLLTAWLPGRS